MQARHFRFLWGEAWGKEKKGVRESLWPHEGGSWGLPAMGSFPLQALEQKGEGHADQLVSGPAHPWIGNFRSQTILQFSKLWDFCVRRQESSPSDAHQTHSCHLLYLFAFSCKVFFENKNSGTDVW